MGQLKSKAKSGRGKSSARLDGTTDGLIRYLEAKIERQREASSRLHERNGLLSGTNDALFAENESLKAEIERVRGMVRIPLAVHNKDAAEYVERLGRGDVHAADYEPIAELLEQLGEARREIERLRDENEKLKNSESFYLDKTLRTLIDEIVAALLKDKK